VLLNASGCLDALTAPEIARSLDAFVTKTVTPLPRDGNTPVRIAETEVGMLNSIGLANPGIDRFVTRTLTQLGKLGLPVWVSVGGFETDDYADICSRLDDHAEVSAIELNVSCPNVDAPTESTTEIVTAARLATRKPLWAKLSPAVPDIAEVARAAQAAGADGLSLINTIRGLKLDPRTLRPTLDPGFGGLSGPALKPIALAAVSACYAAT
jgi:dihydroorotate dehydrogenase (NAD+) catalytic subunit